MALLIVRSKSATTAFLVAGVLLLEGVASIGQGFADEIFRVFRNANPEIQISSINGCKRVSDMIKRVEKKS